MIKEVYPNIYQCEIPLKGSPLKVLNSYVVHSKGKCLIIDTGFNTKECKEALMENLNELKIDISKAEVLATHLHSDHSGLVPYLNSMGAKAYIGKKDGEVMKSMIDGSFSPSLYHLAKILDMEEDAKKLESNEDYNEDSDEWIDYQFLNEGEIIKVGDFNFEVVDIPGHTLGQIGLYERDKKIFFCGDHILEKITPNITFWNFDQDILAIYINNLKKIYNYDIDHLFTAHRAMVMDHRKRVNEILYHHEERLDETIEVMKHGNSTVKDVAQNMQWHVKSNDWSKFDDWQKMFAALETMAHLEHLVFTDKASKIDTNGTLYYKLS